MQKLLLLVAFFYCIVPNYAQEILRSLPYNPQLSKSPSFSKKSTQDINYYIIDTLELPFIDDFSKNLQKNYNPALYPTPKDTIVYNFLVNNNPALKISYQTEKSYIYNVDYTNKKVDSTLNNPIVIKLFDNPENPFEQTNLLNKYPYTSKFRYFINSKTNDIDSVALKPDSTIQQIIKNVKIYQPDKGKSIWINDYAFINNDYALQPPTIGSACFDGLNNYGSPYSSSNITGEADILTSKFINLSNYTAADSLYISFYYQPEGLCDAPKTSDKFSLEFKTNNNTWKEVWSVYGSKIKPFEQVMIKIKDSHFFHNHFQFRFKNYGNLSGFYNTWHLDYVYLNKNRTLADTNRTDVAFAEKPTSFLLNYRTMPWKQYKGFETKEMNPEYVTKIANLDNATRNTMYSHSVTNTANNNMAWVYNDVNRPIEAKTIKTLNLDQKFIFPTLLDTKDSAQFEIKHILTNASNDFIKTNDTIVHFQNFYNYYAYDDGTAEKAYSIEAAKNKVALEFQVNTKDTLRAIDIHFANIKTNIAGKSFRLTVWESLNPEKILYQDKLTTVTYAKKTNEFTTYMLKNPVEVNGKFYVGWEQIDLYSINVGFDRNSNAKSKLFYSINNTNFVNSSFDGALMVRPYIGKKFSIASAENVVAPAPNFIVYPNPTADFIYIQNDDNKKDITVLIIDLTGKIVYQTENSFQINVSNLNNGMYILKIIDNKQPNLPFTQKIIINK